jgi:hypothetical protein
MDLKNKPAKVGFSRLRKSQTFSSTLPNKTFLSINSNLKRNVCPDLTNCYDNIPSKTTWRSIMNTKKMRPGSMTEDQLENVKNEIIQIYFFLISKTGHDPMIVELMKLSALADVQKRYETKEPWLTEN